MSPALQADSLLSEPPLNTGNHVILYSVGAAFRMTFITFSVASRYSSDGICPLL